MKAMSHETFNQVLTVDEYTTAMGEPVSREFAFSGRRATGLTNVVRAAVEKWRWEDEDAAAHDSRSGFGHEIKMVPESRVDDVIAKSSRLEDSLVIPVSRPEDVATKTQKVTVPASTGQVATLSSSWPSITMWQLARIALPGQAISAVQVVKLPKQRAANARSTEGKATTVYLLVREGNSANPVSEHTTIAEARAAGLEHFEQDPSAHRLSVEAVVRRGENRELAVLERPESERQTATLNVSVQAVKPGAKPSHYVVAFDTHR